MLRTISYKGVDLSDEEWKYYQNIESTFGKEVFRDMFEVNKFGEITMVKPPIDKSIPIVLIFFLLNIQFNQKMRKLTDSINNVSDLEKRILDIEEKLRG